MPTSQIPAFPERARAVSEALLVEHGERRNLLGVDEVARLAADSLAQLRDSALRPDSSAEDVAAWVARCTAALEVLDEFERLVWPAIQRSRDMASQLVDDLAAAQRAAEAAAIEAQRAADLDAAIRAEVRAEEQKRLGEIEADARRRLTGARS